jgi:hypothetical protein
LTNSSGLPSFCQSVTLANVPFKYTPRALGAHTLNVAPPAIKFAPMRVPEVMFACEITAMIFLAQWGARYVG